MIHSHEDWKVAAEVLQELERAREKNSAMNSPHEGWAVIREEEEELWDLVKAYPRRASIKDMRSEVIQIAAMAIRFVIDVCDKPDAK